MVEINYELRIASPTQFQRLFFRSKTPAYRRLALLSKHDYLEQVLIPIVKGRHKVAYILGKRGARLLVERGYENISLYAAGRRLKPEFINHTLAINDIFVAMTIACEANGYALEWTHEFELKNPRNYDRVEIPREGGGVKRVALLPDGYFIVEINEKRGAFFLELDRATMSLKRFREKIRAYRMYLKSGRFTKRYGFKRFRVLTVVDSEWSGEKRVANLKRLAEEFENPSNFWFVSLGQLNDLIDGDVLHASVWQRAGFDGLQPLIATEG